MPQEVNLFSKEAIHNPYPTFSYLREHHPVYWDNKLKGWLITRYNDITDMIRDPRFSSDRIRPFVDNQSSADPATIQELGQCLSLWSAFNDPPIHTRLRGLVNKAFVPAMVKRLQPVIEQNVDYCLKQIGDRDEIDFVAEFAYPLPIYVIAEILGIDKKDTEQLKEWSDDLSAFVLVARTDGDKYARALSGLRGMNSYFHSLIEQRRAVPGNTIIDELIASHDGSDVLSTEELVATCVLMLFAGHETTTHFLSGAMRALLLHPEQMADLIENIDSDEVLRNAMNETLRWDSPTVNVVRIALEDVEMHGKTIRKGDRVNLFLSSANRDADIFDDPERFDIRRVNANKNISFGYGIHICMGMHVARMEAQVAFPKLLKSWKEISLTNKTFNFNDTLVTRGVKALSLQLK